MKTNTLSVVQTFVYVLYPATMIAPVIRPMLVACPLILQNCEIMDSRKMTNDTHSTKLMTQIGIALRNSKYAQ